MFPLGHVGIGTHLVPARLRERLPWRWLALGCLLPDVIDKPIWAALHWAQPENDSDLLEYARLFGHTVFFAFAVALVALIFRKPALRALAVAIPTHLVLDMISDWGLGGRWQWRVWLFWPWRVAWHLPRLEVADVMQHFGHEARSRVYLLGELLGLVLLAADYVRWRRSRTQRA